MNDPLNIRFPRAASPTEIIRRVETQRRDWRPVLFLVVCVDSFVLFYVIVSLILENK